MSAGAPLRGFPEPPGFVVEWEALLATVPELQTLAGVAQDPRYHPEGDVLEHTRRVCLALAALPGYRALPGHWRRVLFAAALLHDWGKAETTEVRDDGSIGSPGHARRGAVLAGRWALQAPRFEPEPLDLPRRLALTALVALHSLPLWALSEPDGELRLSRASLTVPGRLLALLAEADVRGRTAADVPELLERLELFAAYCRELGCWEGPRPFASAHSRFRYFQSEGRIPASAELFDPSWGEVTVLSGLPGAGKDHFIARELGGLPVVSLDDLRQELRVSPAGDQGTLVQEATERARQHLRRRRPFVWNATNITTSLRTRLVELAARYGARCRVVYVERPLAQMLAANRDRGRDRVPETVLRRMVMRLRPPLPHEAQRVEYAVNGGPPRPLDNRL